MASNRLWVLIGVVVVVGLGAAYVTSDSSNLFSSGREVVVSDFTIDAARLARGAGGLMTVPIKTSGTIKSETSKTVSMVDIDVTIYSCVTGNPETLEGCAVALEQRISPAGRIEPEGSRTFEATIYLSPDEVPIVPPIRWTHEVLRVHKR